MAAGGLVTSITALIVPACLPGPVLYYPGPLQRSGRASIKCPMTGMAQKVLIIPYLPSTVIKVHHCDRP
jgi:hypothetical protein